MSEPATWSGTSSETATPVVEVRDLHVSFQGRVGIGAGLAGRSATVARPLTRLWAVQRWHRLAGNGSSAFDSRVTLSG